MKKILAGCLIVLVIALCGFAVAGFYAYRMMQPVIENAGNYLDRAAEIGKLAEGITNRNDFTPPGDGELTAAQVERFVAVQARVKSEMADRWTEIQKKSEELQARAKGRQDTNLADFTAVFSSLMTLWVDARKAQVRALNVQKFSDSEYAWVRRRVYEAAGVHLAGGIDMSSIEELARQSSGQASLALPEMPRADVPEANIKLVQPHLATLKDSLPIAVLGL
jgi:hypothetical protein